MTTHAMRRAIGLVLSAVFWVAGGAFASPITYTSNLVDGVEVQGTVSDYYYGGVATSDFYRFHLDAHTPSVSIRLIVLTDELYRSHMYGQYRLFYGFYEDTTDLPIEATGLNILGTYQGSYAYLGPGDFTVAVNISYTGTRDPPASVGYRFTMYNIDEVPPQVTNELPEPGVLWLVFAAVFALVVGQRPRWRNVF